ncbi:MAG: hypothetical protein AAFX00_12525, partial [Pseudomonadota bacterium]
DDLVAGLIGVGFLASTGEQVVWTERMLPYFQAEGLFDAEGNSKQDATKARVAAWTAERQDGGARLVSSIPQDVRAAMASELAKIGPVKMIRRVARYRTKDSWQVSPEGPEGFGSLSLNLCQSVVKSLKDEAHD